MMPPIFSLEDARKVANAVRSWFKRLPVFWKAAITVVSPVAAIAIVIFVAFSGLLGNGMQIFVAKPLLYFFGYLPSELVAPEIALSYCIPKETGCQPRADALRCRTGDLIKVSANIGKPGYLLIFNWDGENAYPVGTTQTLSPQFVESGVHAGQKLVKLDGKVGHEMFYGVTSSLPFSFGDDIRPALVMTRNVRDKGSFPPVPNLILPERFSVDRVFCLHVS
jgi:hypothetical protein